MYSDIRPRLPSTFNFLFLMPEYFMVRWRYRVDMRFLSKNNRWKKFDPISGTCQCSCSKYYIRFQPIFTWRSIFIIGENFESCDRWGTFFIFKNSANAFLFLYLKSRRNTFFKVRGSKKLFAFSPARSSGAIWQMVKKSTRESFSNCSIE